MKDKNDFNKEDLARWYEGTYQCFWCELTKLDKKKWDYANCFHHILGRRGEYNASILNSFFINNELCHLPHHALLRRKQNRIRLLRKTLEWLMSQGYEFTKLDVNFMAFNQDLYKEILEQKLDEKKEDR